MSDLTRFMFRTPSVTQLISVDEIDPDPNQPRKVFDEASLEGLAASLELVGQLQPIVVRKVNGRYMIVVGERRWRAQKLRAHPTIEAKVLSDDIALELVQPAENANREDLRPQELLDAVERATAAGFSKTQIAAALGVSTASVARYRRVSGDEEAAAIVRQGGGLRTALSALAEEDASEPVVELPAPEPPDAGKAPAVRDEIPTIPAQAEDPGPSAPVAVVDPSVSVVSREAPLERGATALSSAFGHPGEEPGALSGRLKDLVDEMVQEVLALPEADRGRCLGQIAQVLVDLERRACIT